MISFSKAISAPDAEAAVDYFAALKPRSNLRVIETAEGAKNTRCRLVPRGRKQRGGYQWPHH